MDLSELVQSGVYIYQERKYELLRARLPVTSQSDCSVYAPAQENDIGNFHSRWASGADNYFSSGSLRSVEFGH